MPNKFLVETALDIGIQNLEKQRNTDAKKLYDEVRSAIGSETSPEIKSLYQRYIDLYEHSVSSASEKSGKLSEEIKWKNISDLKKAVLSGLSGLSAADIEGLNQFALAEYNRQNVSHRSLQDNDTMDILVKWFRLYEGRNPIVQKPAPVSPAVVPDKESLASIESIVPPSVSPSPNPSKSPNPRKAPAKVAKNTSSSTSSSPSSGVISTHDKTPEILTVQQKIIFKDGAYYLTGPKGNTRRVEISELLVNLNLPKNAPENLKKSVKMIEDFSLLLDAYITANPKETAKYDSAVKQVQGLFAQDDIQMGKRILDVTNITSGMFDNFWRTFSDTELKQINDVFRIQDESARRLALLNFIRDGLKQSDIVLAKIMENNSSYFAFPKDEEILRNGDLSAAGLSVAGRQKVEDTIRKARQEAASNWVKNHKDYIDQFKAQNPGVKFDEEVARKHNEELTILVLAKREIMYQKLYNKDVSGELALAQSIMGATTLGMSDKAWDVSKEIGGMIAMEAIAIAAGVVTAGVATATINAAMLGRNAYRGAKALEAYNAASKTRKALTTSARILGSGVGFEFGAASTRGMIENGDWKSMHSLEGYAQSIAMMGVMSGIGKLVTSGRLGQGIQFKEGAGFMKNVLPFTGQVAIEGTAIFGTSATIGSVFFDRRDNWTLEQMAQAMLMAALFKGAGRLTASKNPKGEIEIKQTTTEKIATPTKNDVIPEGTFKSDSKVDLASFTTREITAIDVPTGSSVNSERYIVNGKEYRWSSKQDAFLGKNGEKYTKEEFEILQKENAPKLEYQKENLEIRWDESRGTWIDKNGKIYPNNTKIELDSSKYIYRNTDGTYLVPEKSGLVINQKNGYDIAKVYEAPNGEFYIRRKVGTRGNWEKVESETPVQKPVEKPAQVKTPEAVVKNTEAVIAGAAAPGMARKAMDSVVTSTRKMGESFSAEWLEKMAHKLGKPVKWLADQSVGPVFRMVTGNNPGALLSLVNPMGGWGGKVSTYGKNFVEHWKHPVKNVIDLTITGERKDGQGALSAIAKNVVFAGGITALDYFAVPNENANKAENMAQNYYEMLLLGWLGVVIMEIDPIKEGAKDVKDWISDRIQAKPF